jgi:hypothetical protein
MIDVTQSLDAVDYARHEIRSIHPELATPMLFAAFQRAYIRTLDAQEVLLYQLDQQVRQNEALIRLWNESPTYG